MHWLDKTVYEKDESYADFIYKKLVLCYHEYDSMEML